MLLTFIKEFPLLCCSEYIVSVISLSILLSINFKLSRAQSSMEPFWSLVARRVSVYNLFILSMTTGSISIKYVTPLLLGIRQLKGHEWLSLFKGDACNNEKVKIHLQILKSPLSRTTKLLTCYTCNKTNFFSNTKNQKCIPLPHFLIWSLKV